MHRRQHSGKLHKFTVTSTRMRTYQCSSHTGHTLNRFFFAVVFRFLGCSSNASLSSETSSSSSSLSLLLLSSCSSLLERPSLFRSIAARAARRSFFAVLCDRHARSVVPVGAAVLNPNMSSDWGDSEKGHRRRFGELRFRSKTKAGPLEDQQLSREGNIALVR